jgi:MFS family permease
MGSFYPPYVAMQIPAAVIERYTGAKSLISANLVGVAAALLAMPAAGRRLATGGGIGALVGCSAALGVFAGLLFPVQKQLLKEWAPLSLGAERVWALRSSAFGMQLGIVGTSFLTPVLATKFGWRLVPLAYGLATLAGAGAWQALAASSPRQARGVSVAELALLEADAAPGDAPLGAGGRTRRDREPFRARLLAHPSVVAAMWVNVADNSSMYTLQQWAPVWFMEVLGCSASTTGGYLAVANAVNVAGQFVRARAGARGAALLHCYISA